MKDFVCGANGEFIRKVGETDFRLVVAELRGDWPAYVMVVCMRTWWGQVLNSLWASATLAFT